MHRSLRVQNAWKKSFFLSFFLMTQTNCSAPVEAETDAPNTQISTLPDQANDNTTTAFEASSDTPALPPNTAVQMTEANGSATPDLSPGSEVCGAELNVVENGASGKGHSTRYWDCCMPHCAWVENTSTTSKVCSVTNQITPLAVSYDGGQAQTISRSGCEQRDGVYTCYDQSPWAACDKLAFGFAAVPLNGPDACGSCFQLKFDGRNQQMKYDPNAEPDPGAAQLLGKTMIVMASNTGGDVGSGQFDIMIPGGGLGIFQQGCQNQWGNLDAGVYGATYGGMREACRAEYQTTQEQSQKYQAHMPLEDMKACVKTRCNQAFGTNEGQVHLLEGCQFYADWMGAADNPTFSYQQVECPQALVERY